MEDPLRTYLPKPGRVPLEGLRTAIRSVHVLCIFKSGASADVRQYGILPRLLIAAIVSQTAARSLRLTQAPVADFRHVLSVPAWCIGCAQWASRWRPLPCRHECESLLLRSPKPLAARNQREHEPAAAI